MIFNYLILLFILLLGSKNNANLPNQGGQDRTWNLNRLIDLRGSWKFSIGDNMYWKEPDFNDNSWGNIFVPSPWEDEGFPGYDGYAWYRKKVVLTKEHQGKNIYLRLGYIDDVDEIYINGHFAGFSGSFPPPYFTAYHLERIYKIPDDYWNFGSDNVIAIRVFDAELSGGLVRGKVELCEMKYDIHLEISLEGIWKFLPGDDPERKNYSLNDWDWKQVMVPAAWETQGFKQYDGFGWYRKKFNIPDKYRGQRLILVLGKIDDLDETYLNGKLIGKTGDMDAVTFFIEGEWLEIRGYALNSKDIRYGMENLLAVRVYDGLVQGGIYEGPVGIVKEENYKKWRRASDKGKGIFDFLFENFD